MCPPIGDYGLIGNSRSVALVSKEGSIDYCCMPSIDSPAVFSALLDDKKGGRFAVTPRQSFSARQTYLRDTAILVTTFETNRGFAELADFMPMEGGPQRIHRRLRCMSGTIAFIVTLSARPDFAKGVPHVRRTGEGFLIECGAWAFALTFDCGGVEEVSVVGGDILIRFLIRANEEAHFEFSLGEGSSAAEVCRSYQNTLAFWRAWAERPGIGMTEKDDYISALLNRSLITLKLLSTSDTGAFAAAATNALPEALGGKLNWDYRFCWIRDSAFTIRALYSMGHTEEVDRFVGWLQNTFRGNGGKRLYTLYALSGEMAPHERPLKHLAGYRHSKPVLIGNAAWRQGQWDIYGEAINALFEISKARQFDERLWPFCSEVCELAIANWEKPDSGVWESRRGTRHYVYSKAMCWVALDRAIEIAARHGLDAPVAKWQSARDRIKTTIIERGFDAGKNSFVSHFGSSELDASVLKLPLVGFLPIADPRIQGTIEACQRELMELGFMRRYKEHPGETREGDFVLCSFWLVQCLAMAGRAAEAEQHFETALRAADHLGLFAEMFDGRGGFLLGNFPQGYSHIGLINAVLALREAGGLRPTTS